MFLVQLNWLAVLVAFVISSALAGLYFGVVIAKPYLVTLGRTDRGPSGLVRNLGPVVCGLLVTLTSAVLLRALDVTTLGDALVFGAIVGIGYLSAMTFQIALNPNFPRPLLYGVLNAPYFVVSSLAVSAVLVLWR